MSSSRLIVDFAEVDKDDIPLVGGKGANLGEMAGVGFPVPGGFIVTTNAYKLFLEENSLEKKIDDILKNVDSDSPESLQGASSQIIKLIKKSNVPEEIVHETVARYKKLGGVLSNALVAIRSSATAEDLPNASFAGQQATLLNVKGEANLIEAIRECWASLFMARAIFYRIENKIPHRKVLIAVVVQKMVQSEISGVAFTVDPITNDKNMMVIEAVWGLGEMIVQGAVEPDHYRVNKDPLKVLTQKVAPQKVELTQKSMNTKERKVPGARVKKQKLNEKQILELGKILLKLHKHYYFPQDVEWAYAKRKFYVVQTRPVTTLQNHRVAQVARVSRVAHAVISGTPIIKGIAASPGIGTGKVRKIKSAKELKKIKNGDILVTVMTSPDFVPAMRKVNAIVTDSGGQTSHAAIVSRELGIPCVVGTKNATAFLKNGEIITVDGANGTVYKGAFKAEEKVQGTRARVQSEISLKTATKVYVNLAEPEKAEEVAAANVDGVGLLRAEFMMAEIGVHPKRIIQDKKQKEFVEKLADGLERFCQTFYPRPVVYRATDFKTNEYRNLVGGKAFEPEEPNPLLGFRGAYRYVKNPDVFALEMAAIRRVREKGLKNLWLMIPFVRSPHELIEVKKLIAEQGLIRSPSFQLWMMVELPVNVILLPDFIKAGIDGVSVGSNDLTMLMLGTDRDNEEVAPVFDERSPAVLWALNHVIQVCKKFGITSSICGQAPSSYNDLVQDLVKWGVTSISVNPDAVDRVREVVYDAEKNIGKQ
ncbi:phosphoenolpyruvate synthase [Candidatus Microgenomates bacterium]|nr:phosphoenolpyruvate synthase [Candidatus Microgenomates bacterium]